MSETVIIWLFGTIILLMVGLFSYIVKVQNEQSKKLVAIDEKLQHTCPFGKCPVFERAMKEAAPKRDIAEDSRNIESQTF